MVFLPGKSVAGLFALLFNNASSMVDSPGDGARDHNPAFHTGHRRPSPMGSIRPIY
jgi:hypothetical protein